MTSLLIIGVCVLYNKSKSIVSGTLQNFLTLTPLEILLEVRVLVVVVVVVVVVDVVVVVE